MRPLLFVTALTAAIAGGAASVEAKQPPRLTPSEARCAVAAVGQEAFSRYQHRRSWPAGPRARIRHCLTATAAAR